MIDIPKQTWTEINALKGGEVAHADGVGEVEVGGQLLA